VSSLSAAQASVGKAGPKGRGVFARRKIPRSTRVGAFTGRGRWIWDIPEEVWPHTFQVGYDRYVLPPRDSLLWYINHSCEPNCVITARRIVTARDVQKGEELTFDYSTDVDWPGFRMDCRCGAKGCRGVVRAYRFLPVEVKISYGSHVAPFIQRGYPGKKGLVRGSGLAGPAGRRAAPRGP
jgi:uncharacterized protein